MSREQTSSTRHRIQHRLGMPRHARSRSGGKPSDFDPVATAKLRRRRDCFAK